MWQHGNEHHLRIVAYSILVLILAHATRTVWTFWPPMDNARNLIIVLRTGIVLGKFVSVTSALFIVAVGIKALHQLRLRKTMDLAESLFISIVLGLGLLTWSGIEAFWFGPKSFGVLGW